MMTTSFTKAETGVDTSGVLIETGAVPLTGAVRLIIHTKSGALRLQNALGVQAQGQYVPVKANAGGDDSLVFWFRSAIQMPRYIAAEASTVNVTYSVEVG